ncbi:MAG: tRNA (5-methylaminomethyl-2-thiouridine)(34)-methyltransferase MnmD [Pseudomonadota bacterium]
MTGQHAKLTWKSDAVPVSEHFDDPYFSLQNGLEETRHVFLAGNDLPDRFRPGFQIGELGFGTGLNALTACREWTCSGQSGTLGFTSFEAYPMRPEDMARALSVFPDLGEAAARLLDLWSAGHTEMELAPGFLLRVIIGDARRTLIDWNGAADAWFLDGFSPAKNPELWQPDLMAEVGRHTRPGGTAATYTAAGFVRRGLQAAGFAVTRAPGFGRKRHMTRAVLE